MTHSHGAEPFTVWHRLQDAWIELRREELLVDSNLAVEGATLLEIEPLK